MPVSESVNRGDISVTVTVDGITSEPKKLTVRRPKTISHPDLKHKVLDKFNDIYFQVGAYGFYWTLRDQFGDPMPGILVKETVKKEGASLNVAWRLWPFDVIKNENISKPDGTVPDYYWVNVFFAFDREAVYCAIRQDLDVLNPPYYNDCDDTKSLCRAMKAVPNQRVEAPSG